MSVLCCLPNSPSVALAHPDHCAGHAQEDGDFQADQEQEMDIGGLGSASEESNTL